MDIIHQCLSLAPVPYLAPAFSALRFIWSSIEQAQVSKWQLEALTQSIAQLLQTLDGEYRAGRLLQVKTSKPLADLCRLLDEISAFVQKEASCPFLKLLFTKDRRITQIEGYYRRIGISVESFQVSALLNIHAWQTMNNDARVVDQQVLNEKLFQLESNQQRLIETLNMHQDNVMAMMVSLQRRLDYHSDADGERQFFSHALRYLTTSSGRQVEIENWMITCYEVEFGPKIGSGGFGQVFKGTWNKTPVALKVLATEAGITPNSPAIRREIKTWSMLRHTHVLQFLGANELDDKPFIVMPYLKNGNARDYIQDHPECNRLQILHHVSLGLVYLHSQKIVHGDLKAVNVLIDDGSNAVLCDFGLSHIKADVTSRTATTDGGGIVGSRNWMAPEQLLGKSLKKPCDIYAFGMTLYEIFANEIPLGHVNHADFIELVVQLDIRPEQPDDEDSPQLSDAAWELAEKCWVKDPKQRPTASAVCDTLLHLLATTSIAQPISNPSPSHQLVPVPHQASMPRSLAPLPNLTFRGHTSHVWCAAFSPDGKYIVSGSHDSTIMVWAAQTGNCVLGPLKMHTKGVCCVAFSPDGSRIASGANDNGVLVWDIVTGKAVVGSFKGHTDVIWSVSFSPDGKRIASASYDKTIRIWNAQTGHILVGPLIGHTDSVTSVVFTGDGKRLASGSKDKTVRVWDVKSGRLIRGPLRGHNKWVWFVAFSSDGKRIVAASVGGDVCVWNTDTGSLVSGPSKRHEEGALAAVFSSNGSWCAVSPDGKWIAGNTESDRKTVFIWDSETGLLLTSFGAHSDYIRSVTFSPDSKQVLSASDDKTIRVHNLNL